MAKTGRLLVRQALDRGQPKENYFLLYISLLCPTLKTTI